MKFEFNFEKRHLLFVLLIVMGVVTLGYAVAFANSDGVGHDLDELQPCGNGEILKMIGSKWDCGADIVGGGGGGGGVTSVTGNSGIQSSGSTAVTVQLANPVQNCGVATKAITSFDLTTGTPNCVDVGSGGGGSVDYFTGVTGKPNAIGFANSFSGNNKDYLKLTNVGCSTSWGTRCDSDFDGRIDAENVQGIRGYEVKTASTTTAGAIISCSSGKKAIGGGGNCKGSDSKLAYSMPYDTANPGNTNPTTVNAWDIGCEGGSITGADVRIICAYV